MNIIYFTVMLLLSSITLANGHLNEQEGVVKIFKRSLDHEDAIKRSTDPNAKVSYKNEIEAYIKRTLNLLVKLPQCKTIHKLNKSIRESSVAEIQSFCKALDEEVVPLASLPLDIQNFPSYPIVKSYDLYESFKHHLTNWGLGDMEESMYKVIVLALRELTLRRCYVIHQDIKASHLLFYPSFDKEVAGGGICSNIGFLLFYINKLNFLGNLCDIDNFNTRTADYDYNSIALLPNTENLGYQLLNFARTAYYVQYIDQALFDVLIKIIAYGGQENVYCNLRKNEIADTDMETDEASLEYIKQQIEQLRASKKVNLGSTFKLAQETPCFGPEDDIARRILPYYNKWFNDFPTPPAGYYDFNEPIKVSKKEKCSIS